jgi:RHS repeat-associated protein
MNSILKQLESCWKKILCDLWEYKKIQLAAIIKMKQIFKLISSTNRYTFSGKEKQIVRDLGYLDFGARMLDSEIGRWFVQDPLQEKFYSWSSYNYCYNNPLKFMDPNGKFPIVIAIPWVVGLAKAAFATAATATVVVAASTIHGDTGYREQKKRERDSRREDADIAKRHNDMIDNHVGKPSPDGTPNPKRTPKNLIGKILVGSGLGAAAYQSVVEPVISEQSESQTQQNDDDTNQSVEHNDNQPNQQQNSIDEVTTNKQEIDDIRNKIYLHPIPSIP